MKTITIPKNKDKQVGVRITGDTYEKLKKLSVETDWAISTLAGKILDEFIDEVNFK